MQYQQFLQQKVNDLDPQKIIDFFYNEPGLSEMDQIKCKSVFIEDLCFKTSSSIKISNRKNKNLWKRELFINNLTKRLNILGIRIYSVNPAYSSFIGNLMYDYTDAVNASIEIEKNTIYYLYIELM